MLGGFYSHGLDDKGRVIMPATLKKELGDEFIITRGLDNCLFVMSPGEWTAFEDKLKAMPTSKGRWIQRFFFSGMKKIGADKQGRIQIPQHLREFAGLCDEAVIIGNCDRVEIWSAQRWSESQAEMDSDAIARAMDDISI